MLTTIVTWAVIASTALSYVTALIARHMRRRADRHLTYEWRWPTQEAGARGTLRSFGRAMEAMVYGSSVTTWEARCAASLRASRRRRGLD